MSLPTSKSPVYLMMKKEEHYDIVLIAIIDMMLKSLMDRSIMDDKRWRNMKRCHEFLHKAEQTFVGAIPDEIGNKADKFNRMINADLNGLLKYVKG